jgi:hypothetical protein
MLQPIVHGLTALIVFVGISTPIIVVGMVYYYKKRLEHKQIMAAIEKGIPLSEIMPQKKNGPSWIKNLTGGIMMLLIAAGFVVMQILMHRHGWPLNPFLIFSVIPIVFFANGIAALIRGILQRKVELQNNSLAPENTSSNQV